ncbi:hypothetical protein [Aurantiacibacter gilvus]|uniref:Uncharacterized protein n=1 Tax=Aurantiacibacter gilvus TaxID=3139141 RepID=A0ABU9IDU2_9SPHN
MDIRGESRAILLTKRERSMTAVNDEGIATVADRVAETARETLLQVPVPQAPSQGADLPWQRFVPQ